MVSFACHKENPPLSMPPEIHDDPLDLEWPDHAKSESRPLTKEEWAMASRYVPPRARLGRTVWAWWCMVTLPGMAFLYEKGLAFGDQGWRFSPNENPFDNFWAIIMAVSWGIWFGIWWLMDRVRNAHKVSGRLRLLSRYRLAVGNVEADHEFDDTKLVEGKFYHAVFSGSRKNDNFQVLFIGPLGWGPEEKAGDNWPPRLTLFSWALIPIFLCLHTRMASFAAPSGEIPGGTWQFLWYWIPNGIRFQEGLTLLLYPVVGLVILAGAAAWARWKWRQHQEDRKILDGLGDEPLEAFWRDDRREDLRRLRPDEDRLVWKLVGPRWFLAETISRWILFHLTTAMFCYAWSLNYADNGPGGLDSVVVMTLPLVALFGFMFWTIFNGRLVRKISGEFRRKSAEVVMIGSQVIERQTKVHGCDQLWDHLEEGRFYHALADTHGEDGDEYSIEVVGNHGLPKGDPLSFPLWTLWSLMMSPMLWLLYTRSLIFRLRGLPEGASLMGMTGNGVRLGDFEFPFATNLSGAVVQVAFLTLLILVSLGYLQMSWWAFRKWKAQGSAEEGDLT